jgi:hypothetical protein
VFISPNQFDLGRAPLFREERLKGAVEAQEHAPALVRHGLYSVPALASAGLEGPQSTRGGHGTYSMTAIVPASQDESAQSALAAIR